MLWNDWRMISGWLCYTWSATIVLCICAFKTIRYWLLSILRIAALESRSTCFSMYQFRQYFNCLIDSTMISKFLRLSCIWDMRYLFVIWFFCNFSFIVIALNSLKQFFLHFKPQEHCTLPLIFYFLSPECRFRFFVWHWWSGKHIFKGRLPHIYYLACKEE